MIGTCFIAPLVTNRGPPKYVTVAGASASDTWFETMKGACHRICLHSFLRLKIIHQLIFFFSPLGSSSTTRTWIKLRMNHSSQPNCISHVSTAYRRAAARPPFPNMLQNFWVTSQ